MMNETEATNIVNQNMPDGVVLHPENVNFSNINRAKPVWWLNIAESKLDRSLHLILVGNTEIFVLYVPKGILNKQSFRFRPEKRCIDLEICSNETSPNYMCDIKSGGTRYNFKKHIQERIPIA